MLIFANDNNQTVSATLEVEATSLRMDVPAQSMNTLSSPNGIKIMILNRTELSLLVLGCSLATALAQTNSLQLPPIADGPFKPDWNSLTNYQTPEWFRDAKFGIWAHWGPQCQPEHGDWYARGMYEEGSGNYKSHIAEYGHPSTNGFKDVIHDWKAEHFDPDKLLKFYKDNGAKIFMALANHHDNFDLYNSKYQPWNSVDARSAEGFDRRLGGGGAKKRPALRRERSRLARVVVV